MVDKINKQLYESALTFASKVIIGLNQSVSHFQAVEFMSNQLLSNGFSHIKESENWKLNAGGKYFFTRNQSALFAFCIGSNIDLNTTKFKIIGTHTDSPNLRIAPNSWTKNGNVEKLHLQKYGGGLWNTWFDRDLSLCGKIIYKDNDIVKTKLIRIEESLFNIPSLAIHLTDKSKPFDWNDETHLKVILSMGLGLKFEETSKSKSECDLDRKLGEKLADLISQKAEVEKEKIIDYELVLYDTQPSSVTGINKEYISSGRLDNLVSSLIACEAIINSSIENNHGDINFIGMFDNEEVGSSSFQGADNDLIAKTLERIFFTIDKQPSTGKEGKIEKDAFLVAVNKSFIISSDLAHATHPNYEEKHHSTHKIPMHCGVVIKNNANLRYATESEGGVVVREICKKTGIPILDYMIRQDSPCGSTIGPILSSRLGIKTVDIGVGVWSMHSIRETGSVIDIYYLYKFMFEYLNDKRESYNTGV